MPNVWIMWPFHWRVIARTDLTVATIYPAVRCVAGALVCPVNVVDDGVYLSTTTWVRLSFGELCHMFRRCTWSPSSIRHRRLLPFPGGAHKTRLRQLCPDRASSVFTAAPPVSSQRCGSSGVSTKSLRSCLGHQANSASYPQRNGK